MKVWKVAGAGMLPARVQGVRDPSALTVEVQIWELTVPAPAPWLPPPQKIRLPTTNVAKPLAGTGKTPGDVHALFTRVMRPRLLDQILVAEKQSVGGVGLEFGVRLPVRCLSQGPHGFGDGVTGFETQCLQVQGIGGAVSTGFFQV